MAENKLDSEQTSNAKIRVRARAVDMLGRQQIAGIPSAIHELFKNAYDAFAINVDVDVFRKHEILILRDNGYGMTHDDVTQRWLTLGTESKFGQKEAIAPWMGLQGMKPRRVLGEKGIGRLAIAAIGPAVLLVTRAIREEGLHDTITALIHWGMFEIPGIDLDKVNIPILILTAGKMPSRNDMSALVDQSVRNLDVLSDGLLTTIDAKIIAGIRSDLEKMRFSPEELYTAIPDGPTLDGDGHGTHFLIRPYDPILALDLEEEGIPPDTRPSKLQTLLAGFSNTMFSDLEAPPITAAFRDHQGNNISRDVIEEHAFFTPDDFKMCDHLIDGKFDEHGQFRGSVRIFDRPPISYSLSYPKSRPNPLSCGPFQIRFGYVQGSPHQSLLSPDDFDYMERKLSRLGGLYIYRDGIRVLPYGTIEYDFLRIEQRRNKAHKDWFFAFRRMFGAIVIDSVNNPTLQDKAGREGLRENVAFRQFRDVLENLLMSLAKDFFRRDARFTDDYFSIRDQMDVANEVLKKRESQTRAKKEKVYTALDNFFSQVEAGEPRRTADALIEKWHLRLESIGMLDDPDLIGNELHRAEVSMSNDLQAFGNSYRISRPRGLSLSKSGEQDWLTYRKTLNGVCQVICASA